MRNILITGASGFVGTCVIRELLKDEQVNSVFAVLNKSTLHADLTDKRIKTISMNLLEPWSLSSNIDQVYNFAADGTYAPYSIESSELFEKISEQAIRFSIKKEASLFQSSSGGAEKNQVKIDNRLYHFANARKNVERRILESDLDEKILFQIGRLYSFIGPTLYKKKQYMVNQFLQNASEGKNIVITGRASSRRTYLYETDMANWIMEISKSKLSGLWNISGYEKVSIQEIASHIGHIYDVGIEYLPLETEPSDYFPENMSKEQIFGLSQSISWKEGLELTAKWISRNKGK